jgi:hypothetical protein
MLMLFYNGINVYFKFFIYVLRDLVDNNKNNIANFIFYLAMKK